jgi:hypothetical protein
VLLESENSERFSLIFDGVDADVFRVLLDEMAHVHLPSYSLDSGNDFRQSV